MKRSLTLSVAVGAGLTLALAGIAPATSASGAVTDAPSNVVASDGGIDWQSRSAAVDERLGIDRSPAREALDRVINPGDYECGPTNFDVYIDGLFAGMTDEDIDFLFSTPVLDLPTYDALVFGRSSDPAYALPSSHATSLGHTFRDVKRFWDIESGDIQLHAMHGDMLLDPARISRTLQAVYGVPAAAADAFAADWSARIAATPAFDGGNNPLFTLNAFAFTGEGDPDPFVSSIPDKLIFGDGILDALQWLGIGNVGPRAVMGHEFGHHIQYEDNLFDSPLTGPEATRRTELMADAFGTYFAVHSRGLSLNAKRVLQAEQTFYEVGDCAFTNPGHHGTPNQRMRASEWGADLASSAQRQGKILPSLTVAEQFDVVLPELVAPDAA